MDDEKVVYQVKIKDIKNLLKQKGYPVNEHTVASALSVLHGNGLYVESLVEIIVESQEKTSL